MWNAFGGHNAYSSSSNSIAPLRMDEFSASRGLHLFIAQYRVEDSPIPVLL